MRKADEWLCKGHQTETRYDLIGRSVAWQDALGNEQRTAYLDAQSRKVTTDALGRSTTYQYDGRGFLRSVTYPDGQVVSYTYDAVGNRLTMTDGLGTTSYSYDVANRLARKVDPFGRVLNYSYTGQALTGVTSPVGTMAYTYDLMGRMTQLNVTNTGAVQQRVKYWARASRWTRGAVRRRSRPHVRAARRRRCRRSPTCMT